MHPFISYEMGRQANEERRAKALRMSSWRFEPDSISHRRPSLPDPESRYEADVIEVIFGAQCEAEDAIA